MTDMITWLLLIMTDTKYERSKKALIYVENNFIDPDGNMYLPVDSLIKENNIIAGWNNIFLRKGNVTLYGFDKIYMDKEILEDKIFQIMYQFIGKKITPVKCYSILLITFFDTFYHGMGRTCKILYANGDK